MLRDEHPPLLALNKESMTIFHSYFGGTEATHETGQIYTSVVDATPNQAETLVWYTANHN